MKIGTIGVVFFKTVAVLILLNLVVPAMVEAQHSANRTAGVSPQANNSSAWAGGPGLGEYGTGFGPGGYGSAGVGGVGGPALPFSTGIPGHGNQTGNASGG